MTQVWKTVRVFISSTFRDMHDERDYLGRVVFPELRERCAGRRLHLVDMNLRWGVTEEEAEQGKVLQIILDEIDRSRPFFIAILGERYGSVPDKDKVPEDAELAYPWLPNYPDYSLTALEIVHGVLHNPDLASRSFFYFRDPQFTSQVPESKCQDFTAESPEAVGKVADLKEKVRASGVPVMEDYPCRWDDTEERLVGLDTFGQQVLDDLWTAICDEYPEEESEADPVAMERRMHEAFVEERSHLHIGRAEQMARLTEYVQGRDRRPVVIIGESGCGKSAFLASWYRQYATEHPGDYVLAYFLGASPHSSNYRHLLRNMCEELRRQFALKEEIPPDDEKLPETLARLLLAASQGKRIVLLVDALDQLLPLEGMHGLSWLLDYITERVRLVVSSLGGNFLDVLRRRKAEEIILPPLTDDEQRQIVDTLLGLWRRRLDNRQMAALLAHHAVQNPLYLRVALEELRLFGSFEHLTQQIEKMAGDIPGLFKQVLMRLEEDHGRELVAEAFSLLACSRHGLSEAELLDLLRREGEERFPRPLWARLAFSARPYLVQRGEFLGFFHRQLADAVAARYLRQENKHSKLAAYFEQAPLERKLEEYPYQLERAKQWPALAAALSDLDFFLYAFTQNRKYEWMGYWRSLKGHFEPAHCYQAAIEARGREQGENEYLAVLLHNIGTFLFNMALFSSALPLLKRALAITERTLGPDHPNVATILTGLAVLYLEQGKYDEAEPLLKQTLAITERALGPDHPDMATILNNLAKLYQDQGKYDQALPLHQQALAITERALGPDHPDMATRLNGLAELYEKQGKYDEAEPLFKQALAIEERALGPDHPDVATSLNNLASLYRAQGKYDEAESLLKRALAIYERTLGPDHPDVEMTLNKLAKLYRA